MPKKIAINGFGRIGKTFLKTILQDKAAKKELEVVAINIGPEHPNNIDILFKYDSLMRTFPGKVHFTPSKTKDCAGILNIEGSDIKIIAEPDPLRVHWETFGATWIVESSGAFRTRENASKHLTAGAKKVLITAPAIDEDITIIPGVNDKTYDAEKHHIISLGSCTTNCFAPMVKVLKESFDFKNGVMTTIHAYTNDQVLIDTGHKDPRRARAAALNIIPTETGADKVITKIYPELKGKLRGISLRVPTPIVSLVDFSFTTNSNITKEHINSAFKAYCQNELKEIMEYCEKPLVSSDFMQNSHSCIFDSLLTKSLGNISNVFGWYDNEFGYCCRLKDFLFHN
jgi:glyceraldehyde-3-phosphate dehydrogenase type I